MLTAQGGRYLLVERGPEAEHHPGHRLTGAVPVRPDQPSAALAVLTDEPTRLVTLTITGNGYRIGPHSGEFDGDDEHLATDLEDPGEPATLFGYLVEALSRRRDAAVHRALLRQHAVQRRRCAQGGGVLRPAPKPGPGRLAFMVIYDANVLYPSFGARLGHTSP
nr:hypothetical protein [Modestobacter excelsi]